MMIEKYAGRLSAALVFVSLFGTVAEASDTGTQKSNSIGVRTPRGVERFQIEATNSVSSPAQRLNDDMASKEGVAPAPTPGYTLSHRVIVSPIPDDEIFPFPIQPMKFAPNHGVITTSSVGHAITLADELKQSGKFDNVYVDMRSPVADRLPVDPSFLMQWHLINLLNPGVDSRVAGVWAKGFTGTSTIIGILEAGFQTTHPDLAANFNAEYSMTGGITSGHATAVAGIAAAVAGNGIGGVGVAYDAQITKLVYGVASDTANALGWRNDVHSVKNNSWGPLDNGTIATISSVELEALSQSVNGRNGFGTIIVWAGGNGAAANDRVDYDPYASSRFAIAVGAINDLDKRSIYSEPGASLLVVAPSSGGPTPGHRSIFTTTAGSGFTSTFGGTSAAAPIVSGVVALLLDAVPYLSWRDVQHILVDTARRCDPHSPTWQLNGAGLLVSYDYGYGAIDAMAALNLAERWHPMSNEKVWSSNVVPVAQEIPDNSQIGRSVTIPVSTDMVAEAIELKLNVSTTYVGDLAITLRSPSGTESILALSRSDSNDNLVNQIFTTKRHWGERTGGNWRVTIKDLRAGDIATWHDFTLNVYGHCPSDVNRDGVVDVLDLLDFIESYNACEGQASPCFGSNPVAADYNRDGEIDVLDLLDLMQDLAGGC